MPESATSPTPPVAEADGPRRSPTVVAVRVCQRCVLDTGVSQVKLDAEGICNHCRMHEQLERVYGTGAERDAALQDLVARIRRAGRGRPYDCLIGVSGGRDSSWMLHMTKKVLGLRPLAVHFDNGWDSEIAKRNLQRLLTKLDVDLHTVVADWEESRELTKATIRASLPYIEITDEIGVVDALYRTACREGIRWILTSHSFRREGTHPLQWNYMDGRLVRDVVKKFGTPELKKRHRNVYLSDFFYWVVVRRIRAISIAPYYDDMHDQVEPILRNEYGWESTGGWHFDNELFGLQCFYTRKKFGFDWRLIETAAQVRSGTLSREAGFAKLAVIPPTESPDNVNYALKKLGISQAEWQEILAAPIKYHTDYSTYYPFLCKLKPLIKFLSRRQILPGHTYEKFFET